MKGTSVAQNGETFVESQVVGQELLSGAQIFVRCLEEEGVHTIFGYPGGAVIDIYHQLARSKIRHILVRHEQGGVHAADGFARASGDVGVCLVTSGPGATNTVTGIACAYMDSIPVVVFTGQVPTALIGNDAFQEVDIVGITRPCTKHNYLVTRIEDLPRVIKEAFYLARSGRPGPVLVDLPKDLMKKTMPYCASEFVKLRSYQPTYRPNMKQLRKVVDLIKKAKRPMILAGGGVVLSRASRELTELATRISAPVTTTLMGLGVFSASHERLWLGMIGMHGTYRANMCTGACDLIIAIGVRFDDRVTGKTDAFAKQAKIVHIDIDPTSIRKNVPVTIPVVGDCKATLQLLNRLLKEENLSWDESSREEWLCQIEEWKATRPLAYKQGERIKPQYVIEKLYELTEGKAIITTEVGQNQMWAAQYYHFDEPNSFVTSGGLGCMGFGLPAAIGAQLARPDRTVVDVAGDGSIQMNIQELATAVQYNLPVKVLILNNGYLGMVRQWQELFYDKCYSSTCMEHAPDFVKLADAYGAVGLRATRPDEVVSVLDKGLSLPRPVVMDFWVEPEENVYPMVPAGAPITEMLLV
ncbi:MAG: biosynthetic-type acetolactate synthase large subunit [Deltaproteobacteria bacterium]|nr:biosynthetic-type acetolactate synthase large subunit [Deltaproteobacteria bacterium]MBW1928187.1 biosynthetic-type acetolactate synthase large subunit [Deltaproteobacteria bacterium]MBW2025430.1 biosynthetic-type acetolactate synthase large subunit [Deltaproteobacteria bacterium]MBW2126407.1 biosynthetic-type acetolactate synthase large subunit [Deltaproteobacteria bacterium]RLB16164.1 MAG: biosynthetic-type acetolactate synthase large subunit [Deltaproteobacteria bacterium]